MQRRYPGTGFGVDARRQQAWFRNNSPTVSDKGRSPTDDKGLRNPHLLALGSEEDNLYPGIRGTGGAVEYFEARRVPWWRSARSGDDRRKDGPTRNMASSQVACVNFLLPLARTPGALTAALRAVDDDVLRAVAIHHEGNASPVEFEWVGLGGPLEGAGARGANATSIDAFLLAETPTGRRAYLLEWKYVEQYLFTTPEFKGEGKGGDTRRERYGELYRAQSSSFDLEAAPELDEFLYEPFYQIMRQTLLADRMVRERELNVGEAKVVVVAPEQNLAYRSVGEGGKKTSPPLVRRFPQMATVEEVVRAALKDPDAQFSMVAPSAMLGAVERGCPGEETAAWVGYWRERYGV